MTERPKSRVGVVGSGLAGLATAHFLARYDGVQVTVFEQDDVVGGRANTVDGAEHCARLFLDDYEAVFEVLREIHLEGERTVFDALEPVRRFSWSSRSGWVENQGLYPLLSRGLSAGDRVELFRQKRLSPLVAAQRFGSSTNRYGNRTNFTLASKARILLNALQPRACHALPGPTASWFIEPWVHHLAARGVEVRTGARVTRLVRRPTGTSLEIDGEDQRCDVTVLTAFVSDALPLLDRSQIRHQVPDLSHSHCKCFTIALDPREPILSEPGVRIYAHEGIGIIVQPAASRCVVLCTLSLGTTDDYVLPRVRASLGLRHRLVDVISRDNVEPREALFHATLVDPAKAVEHVPGLHLAGSWVHNSYVLDAGEGAVRTARSVALRVIDAARRVDSRQPAPTEGTP